jgi:hypothetical protein
MTDCSEKEVSYSWWTIHQFYYCLILSSDFQSNEILLLSLDSFNKQCAFTSKDSIGSL